MQPRTKIAAVGATVALGLGAGCADAETTDPGGETTDPSVLLASSADAMAEESFKIEMTMGEIMTVNGAVDPASGYTEMTMSMSEDGINMDMQIVATETDMWMNLGEIGAVLGAEGWVHIDLSAFGEDVMGMSSGGTDPSDAAQMLNSMSGVEQVDDRTFEGAIDLAESGGFQDEAVAHLEDTTVPFTATMDDESRLSTVVMQLPEAADMPPGVDSLEIRYYDYGAPVEISEPPADEVVPMPDAFQEMVEQM